MVQEFVRIKKMAPSVSNGIPPSPQNISGGVSFPFPNPNKLPKLPETPQDAILLGSKLNPDIIHIHGANPPNKAQRVNWDKKHNAFLNFFAAAASKGEPDEIGKFIRIMGHIIPAPSDPISIRTNGQLMHLGAKISNNGIHTLNYPQILREPTRFEEQRDICFLGVGHPDLLNLLADQLTYFFQPFPPEVFLAKDEDPTSSMRTFHYNVKAQGATIVMLYSLFKHELYETGLPFNKNWDGWLKSVDKYVKILMGNSKHQGVTTE